MNQNHKAYCLKGGRIIDVKRGVDAVGDLYVVNGVISADPVADADVIDCSGKVVSPGLIDIHVHLRQPGNSAKETIRSGTQAAAVGGFTTIVAMPNTSPRCDTPSTIEWLNRNIKAEAVVKVLTCGNMTKNGDGLEMAGIGSLKQAGVAAISDDGKCVQNHKLMRNIVEYAKAFELPLMDHCEEETMMSDGVMHEGYWSLVLGMKGIPYEAESLIVARNIMLARRASWNIHMQHISAGQSVELLREARAKGIPVTGEVTPHHLALTDETIKTYDANYKMNPPLMSEKHRQALIAGLQDGTLTVIATDHAPHTWTEKTVEFDAAPFGIVGLETALPVCLTELVHKGYLTLPQLLEKMTVGPAEVLLRDIGTLTPGSPADITVIDPDFEFVIDPSTFYTKSRNTPFGGYKAKGCAVMTIVDGVIVFQK